MNTLYLSSNLAGSMQDIFEPYELQYASNNAGIPQICDLYQSIPLLLSSLPGVFQYEQSMSMDCSGMFEMNNTPSI